MRNIIAVACFGVLLAFPCLADSPGSPVYDDFNGRWLDLSKWATVGDHCWNNCLESVRLIDHGKLRLGTRSIGSMSSDHGAAYSDAFLSLTRPVSQAITTLQADIDVREFEGLGCTANSDDVTNLEASIGGQFFNAGGGGPGDDVTALLIVFVDTVSTPTMNVGLWWMHGADSYWTPIAAHQLGTTLVANITWDQANHQFVGWVKAKDSADPPATVTVPYSLSDTTPAANPDKRLSTLVGVLNCTSVQTTARGEALFDNVIAR